MEQVIAAVNLVLDHVFPLLLIMSLEQRLLIVTVYLSEQTFLLMMMHTR